MEKQNESKGALIGSIIIVIVLIVGGIYFAKQVQEEQLEQSPIEQVLQEDADIQAIEEGAVGDEVPELESALDEIDLDELETIDLESIEI